MDQTIKSEWLSEVFAEADLYDEPEIHEAYSGRCMYGATCFGVVFATDSDQGSFLAALGVVATRRDLAGAEAFDPIALAKAMATDSMGRGTIVYFPGWTLAD